MSELVIRDFEERDYGPLVKIVNDEWTFHLYGDDWPYLARMYIRGYMDISDYIKVLDMDGEAVGIVCAWSRHPREPSDVIRTFEKEYAGSEYIRDRDVMDAIDDRFVKEYGTEDMGKLELLIVSPSVKGRHAGTMLLEAAVAHLRKDGCKGMFVATDDYCNYGFYEHLGAVRIGMDTCTVQKLPLERYMYVLAFDRKV
ncbi:MAG: GNAT family N-acetyltransferase [archaeon]|nr:GNAT family N-acetyltransferase [archaeon]